MLYLFASIQQKLPDGSIKLIKGLKEPANRYATRELFVEHCFAAAKTMGYERGKDGLQVSVIGPVHTSADGRRTLKSNPSSQV